MCVCVLFVWYTEWHHTPLQFAFTLKKVPWRYGHGDLRYFLNHQITCIVLLHWVNGKHSSISL